MSKKITQLPATAAVTATDLFEKVNDPSGIPVSQKASVTQLVSYLGTLAPINLNSININAASILLFASGGADFAGGACTIQASGSLNANGVIIGATGTDIQTNAGEWGLNGDGSAFFGSGNISLAVDGSASFLSVAAQITDNGNAGDAVFLTNWGHIGAVGGNITIDNSIGGGNPLIIANSGDLMINGQIGQSTAITVLTALPNTFSTLHFTQGILTSVT